MFVFCLLYIVWFDLFFNCFYINCFLYKLFFNCCSSTSKEISVYKCIYICIYIKKKHKNKSNLQKYKNITIKNNCFQYFSGIYIYIYKCYFQKQYTVYIYIFVFSFFECWLMVWFCFSIVFTWFLSLSFFFVQFQLFMSNYFYLNIYIYWSFTGN